jgi:two-component system, OmpR family, copper resistance phosphate regulon response regulator CusR
MCFWLLVPRNSFSGAIMKILVIEDDEKTARFLAKGLTEQGFVVDICHDGDDGLELALSGKPDAVILDVMLPTRDGWSVLTEMRRRGNNTPVLMLTARDAIDQRVKGLGLGADDYLVKPFAFAELLARIQSCLRRRTLQIDGPLQHADLIVDMSHHRVTRSGTAIELTPKELLLLSFLLRYKTQVLSRALITEHVWDMNFDADSNVVDVHIRRLRSKVDEPFAQKLIHTIRGRGYVLR